MVSVPARIAMPETVRSIDAYPSFSIESITRRGRCEHWSTARSPAGGATTSAPAPRIESFQVHCRPSRLRLDSHRVRDRRHHSRERGIAREVRTHGRGKIERLCVAPRFGQRHHLCDLRFGPANVGRPPGEPSARRQEDQRRVPAARGPRPAPRSSHLARRVTQPSRWFLDFHSLPVRVSPDAGRRRRGAPEPELELLLLLQRPQVDQEIFRGLIAVVRLFLEQLGDDPLEL